MEGWKVITGKEMARIESLAYEEGYSDEVFMENGGIEAAQILEMLIKDLEMFQQMTLLIGKGNNGGDGYVLGRFFVEKGFSVTGGKGERPIRVFEK